VNLEKRDFIGNGASIIEWLSTLKNEMESFKSCVAPAVAQYFDEPYKKRRCDDRLLSKKVQQNVTLSKL
jgi:hypothetical protein